MSSMPWRQAGSSVATIVVVSLGLASLSASRSCAQMMISPPDFPAARAYAAPSYSYAATQPTVVYQSPYVAATPMVATSSYPYATPYTRGYVVPGSYRNRPMYSGNAYVGTVDGYHYLDNYSAGRGLREWKPWMRPLR